MEDYMYSYEPYRENLTQEIKNARKISPFTQEQAEKEIGKIIDSKKFPNYILDKGQYKYDGNINAVYFIEDFKLRSQPNPEARIITEESAFNPNLDKSNFASEAYSYLGEWTNPKGEEWVIIKKSENDQDIIGFVPIQNSRFVTNEQIKKVAD